LAARLESTEAAATLAQAITQTKDPSAPLPLAKGLSAVAARLEPKDAQEVAAALTRAMSGPTRLTNNDLQELAKCLAKIAARFDLRGTKDEGTALLQVMSKTTDSDRLQALSKCLAAVLSRDPTERRVNRFGSASGLVGVGTSPMVLSLPLALQNPELEAPPEALPSETLVELLRHPLCVGGARRVVLDQLGSHYGRHFEDQWDFVRFAEEHKLGLDRTNPVQRP
jgi:hypothetical protein